MTLKQDLDLKALTIHAQCRECGDTHRIPVLYEHQHMAALAVAANEPQLAESAQVKVFQMECPRVGYPTMKTDWIISIPYDHVLVAIGDPRL